LAPARILFVDDEPGIRETLPRILTMHGFEVTCASSVAEALAKIASAPFDVLVSDLNIGHAGDGFTVVSAMRRTQPACITLILTGFPAFETALQAIRSQVDDYLVKPAKVSNLVNTIQARLSAPGRKAPDPTAKRMAEIIRENSGDIVGRTLSAIKAHPDLAAAPISDETRIYAFAPLLAELADRLESPEPGPLSEEAMNSAVLRGRVRRSQGYSIPMVIASLRLLEQSLYDVVGEHLLQLDVSFILSDINRIRNQLMQELEVTVNSFLQAERRLAYERSGKWAGWFCERCCWNRPEPESQSDRVALALTINAEFEAHTCDGFAAENDRSSSGQ
jgi:ActR/RegA family two-component response regulator